MSQVDNNLNQEAEFKIDEMFVSRTDEKGIILSGNETFVKISGYEREKIIGSPHNIIRHPDMPKCVFKLFWDTINQKKPIMAYVKNKAIDGKYYWVFASVFPVSGGFLSIRIKPSSNIFPLVKKIIR